MEHFLAPLKVNVLRHVLRNASTGTLLADHIEHAFDSSGRRRGLLGRNGLPPGHVLILAPCPAIHTCFMRFNIDVVFAKRDGEVIKVRRGVKPWQAAGALRAFAAIEFPEGGAVNVRPGDRVTLESHRCK